MRVMFTGIVEDIGCVESLLPQENLVRLTVQSVVISKGMVLGESVSVDGVCLTVASVKKNCFAFDVMKETLDKTTLGSLKKGARVNLERALKVGGRFGGHIVTGHVDGVTEIHEIIRQKNHIEFQLKLFPQIKKFIVPKGSVCLNGISLTIGEVSKNYFSVYLIPFTMKSTTMSVIKPGDRLNIEVDVLARYILNR